MTTELVAALRLIATLSDQTAAAVAREAVARFEKAPTAGAITYVVQGRCVIGGRPGDWEETPMGGTNKTMYAAIAEMERYIANCKDPEGRAPFKEAGEFLRSVIDMYQKGQAHLELRILKRVTVDEAMEETARAI